MKRSKAPWQMVCVVAAATLLFGNLGFYRYPWRRPDLAFAQRATTAYTTASPALTNSGARLAEITVDYPADRSIFPPEIVPPTFLWRDATAATAWTIDVSFTDGPSALRARSAGEHLRMGEIDPRCVSANNALPKLTPQQAAEHTWIPDVSTWEAMKQHSSEHPATITFTGFESEHPERPVSRGAVVIATSKDPVGAPIFYRDVPLIPAELKKGVINPLSQGALPLLAWRLRSIAEPNSRLLLTGMHTCANCHSFSRDGKTLGMDLDGPANDKGLYAIASIQPEMAIRNQDVISWSAFRDDMVATSRVGFMSQISPDGRYVLTMLRGVDRELARTYYVVNFKAYEFSQVFYPTRGILAWYDRSTGQRRTLPGADDPRYVQTDGVWSPDGKFVVFARAEAREPYVEGRKLPEHANDPEETQIQYDLYRIPFNEGKGGQAVPIAGASHNGMSNTFPKVSPDGRWIVFVQCRNGQLMRPDSQLYIVPATGGVARRMRCNTSLMNSWHSFSPNGRWLVFASKSRSPYTQMFLTHLDAEGNDSPAILIENSTAANRAVNLPEFVNIPPNGLMKIDVPAADSYRLFDIASDLTAKGQYAEGIAEWKRVLELDPENVKAHNNLGGALVLVGNLPEGMEHLQKALEIDPDYSEAQSNLGLALLQVKKLDEAMPHLQRSLELNPAYSKLYDSILASMEVPANPSAVTGLRLDDALHPPAEESEEAHRVKRETLETQYRETLEAVLAYLTVCADPAHPAAPPPESNRQIPQELSAPGASARAVHASDNPPQVEDLIARLEIPHLRQLAELADQNSDESFAAERQILRIFLHTFEASTALLRENKVSQALACLKIAVQAAPTNPYIIYDLARAQALGGETQKAIGTLQAAAEKGFNNASQTESDRAFAGLRNQAGFQSVLASMRRSMPQTAGPR